MRTTSIKISEDTLATLRRLAHEDSLATNQEVTASSIIRGLVEDYLRERRVSSHQSERPAG
jgi:hypothetical protein